MKPLRTAILGYGRSGSTLHAGPVGELPDFELAAVCDIDGQARENAAKRFKCRLFEKYTDLFDLGLDLIVIVTRSSQHSEMACACLEAGINVLVTKPWALNEAEALNMIQASRKSGAKLLPWLPARWGEDLAALRELTASGAIGKVFMIRRSVFTFGVRCDWQTEKRYGGGYLLNWGPHLVDQPVQLAGAPVQKIYGVMKQVINPGDAEDVFFAVMNTGNGVTIVTEFNFGASALPDWLVLGDRGSIVVRGREIEIHAAAFPEKIDPSNYRNAVDVKVTKTSVSGNLYGDERIVYREIAGALRGEAAYPVTPESALALTRTLDAIRKSAETGAAVGL
ncbi:MAG: Gfo/Idh/MocA family oxidoreductase [Treponema sp.]|jgi:predicted dehydrogenase|nr:Gfo/Idh/MocA family oxidoreductase [Treponema sp.]